MISYCASFLYLSAGSIADFVRDTSQTGVLVGVGSLFLIFGGVLRRHLALHEDQSGSEEFVAWEHQLEKRAPVPVLAPVPIVRQGNVASSYPALSWESAMPLNRYVAGLDTAGSTVASRSRLNVL